MKIQIKKLILESDVVTMVRSEIQIKLDLLKDSGILRKRQSEIDVSKIEQAKEEIGADNVEKIKDEEQHASNLEESARLTRKNYIEGKPFSTMLHSGKPGGKQSKLSKEGITNKEEGPKTVENYQAKHASGVMESTNLFEDTDTFKTDAANSMIRENPMKLQQGVKPVVKSLKSQNKTGLSTLRSQQGYSNALGFQDKMNPKV